jgi:hypothetical protein
MDYFKDLAKNHADINSFVGYSSLDFQTQINTVKGLDDFILVLYNYEAKLEGNNQRTISQRSISFAILKKVKELHDFNAQYKAIAECEVIGLEVLSRVNYDSKLDEVKWLYNNFVKESVNFKEVGLKTESGLFGMEFFFDIKTPEPLTILAEKWDDIESVC